MSLCKCGCGSETKPGNIYINGHNTKGLKRDPSVALKRKRTFQTKYNVDCAARLSDHREKCKQTCLDHFGVESHNQSESVKLRKVQSYQKHYGVDNPNQSQVIKDQKILTCQLRYGVDNPLQCQDTVDKMIRTNQGRYGGNSPFSSDSVKEKCRDTWLSNSGFENPFQNPIIKDQIRRTNIDRYGVSSYTQTSEFREFMRGIMIDAISLGFKDGQKFAPMKGKNEISFISELQKHVEFPIVDHRLMNYFPDGFIKELNIVIEFDEPFHECDPTKQRDLQKDEDYRRAGMKVFRIKENDWLLDKDSIISKFKLFLCDCVTNKA